MCVFLCPNIYKNKTEEFDIIEEKGQLSIIEWILPSTAVVHSKERGMGSTMQEFFGTFGKGEKGYRRKEQKP